MVRLEVQPNAEPEMVFELTERFGLTADDVYEMSALLDYTTLFEIAGLEIEALRDPPWAPLSPIALEDAETVDRDSLPNTFRTVFQRDRAGASGEDAKEEPDHAG